MSEVNHPEHYGGKENPYEAIKVIEAWQLGFCLGNTVKYISRAGKKGTGKELQDLEKALWYLQRRIDQLKCDRLDKSIDFAASICETSERFKQMEDDRHKEEMKKLSLDQRQKLFCEKVISSEELQMGKPVHPSLIPPNHKEHL